MAARDRPAAYVSESFSARSRNLTIGKDPYGGAACDDYVTVSQRISYVYRTSTASEIVWFVGLCAILAGFGLLLFVSRTESFPGARRGCI